MGAARRGRVPRRGRARVHVDRAAGPRVWPFSFGMVVAAAGVAALLLGAAGAGGGHLLDLALGMLAAAGALAIVARLASTAGR